MHMSTLKHLFTSTASSVDVHNGKTNISYQLTFVPLSFYGRRIKTGFSGDADVSVWAASVIVSPSDKGLMVRTQEWTLLFQRPVFPRSEHATRFLQPVSFTISVDVQSTSSASTERAKRVLFSPPLSQVDHERTKKGCSLGGGFPTTKCCCTKEKERKKGRERAQRERERRINKADCARKKGERTRGKYNRV